MLVRNGLHYSGKLSKPKICLGTEGIRSRLGLMSERESTQLGEKRLKDLSSMALIVQARSNGKMKLGPHPGEQAQRLFDQVQIWASGWPPVEG